MVLCIFLYLVLFFVTFRITNQSCWLFWRKKTILPADLIFFSCQLLKFITNTFLKLFADMLTSTGLPSWWSRYSCETPLSVFSTRNRGTKKWASLNFQSAAQKPCETYWCLLARGWEASCLRVHAKQKSGHVSFWYYTNYNYSALFLYTRENN